MSDISLFIFFSNTTTDSAQNILFRLLIFVCRTVELSLFYFFVIEMSRTNGYWTVPMMEYR